MAILSSNWPGKCRRCHKSHLAGDMVWWEKGLKGVLCMSCHTGSPPKPPMPPAPSPWLPPWVPMQPDKPTEEDDLKKPAPDRLKRGHELSASTSQLIKLFGCALHDLAACNCPGCILLRGGVTGQAPSYVTPPEIRAVYSIQDVPCALYPGASEAEQQRHARDFHRGYRLQFKFSINDTPYYVDAYVPLYYIPRDLSVVAGAPKPEAVVPVDVNTGTVKYLGGTVHGRFPNCIPPVTVVPRYEAVRCKPLTTLDAHKLVGAVMAPMMDANGTLLNGSTVHHGNQACKCQSCEAARAFTLLRTASDTYRVTQAFVSGDFVHMQLIRKGDDDYRSVRVSVHNGMAPEKLAATLGLAIIDLNVDLVLETPDVPTTGDAIVDLQNILDNPKKEAPIVAESLNEAANSLIAALQASAVPEARVREIALETVASEFKKLTVRNHKIKFNDGAPIEFDGILHGMATEIAEAIVCGFHNIMVVGPAGSGKTYLFSQVATLLQKQMGWDESDYKASMSCAPGQTESMFIGRMIPSLTTGTETYHGTNLTRLYSKPTGGAFLFDEISNSEPTVMNLVNSMIALDGHVTLPDGRILERPPKMVVFAADNTWGQGGDRLYIRNQLDAATLDRFTGAKFFMDYDEKLELALCPILEVYEAVKNLRQKVTNLKLRRIVSTRAFSAAQRMGSNGMKPKDILKRLTIDWSENDRKSVGV